MERGNRRQPSVTTFGPVGRLLATGAVLLVLAWFLLFGGFFGLAGAVIWVGWVMPRALRDVWRRAELPSTDLTRLRDEARGVERPPGETHLLFRNDGRDGT
ncbi:MAG: hypothetical protein JWL79_3770 [Frankiales bacterium]|nr:hypothetical protein [Frankiales bacterium]